MVKRQSKTIRNLRQPSLALTSFFIDATSSRIRQTFFGLIFFLGLAGCAVTNQKHEAACAHFDWFTVGRNDASSGKSQKQLEEHRLYCQNTRYPIIESLYLAGYNAGLVDYCTYATGVGLGQQGQSLPQICPEPLNSKFEFGHRIGTRIHDLNAQNEMLQSNIQELIRQMTKKTNRQDFKTRQAQLELLRKKRLEIDQEISKIEKASVSQ